MTRKMLALLTVTLLSGGLLCAQGLDDLFADDDSMDDVVAESDDAIDDADADADLGDEEVIEVEESVEEIVEVEDGDAGVEVPEPVVAPEPQAEVDAEEAVAEAEEADAEDDGKSVLHILAMYFPNRFIDLADIFSTSAGVGAETALEFRITRFMQLGGAYGDSYFLTKGYNRQCGGGYSSGYNIQNLCWVYENRYVEDSFGTVENYIHKQQHTDIPWYSQDDYKNNIRDLWAIGVKAGWLLNVDFHIHPVEIADFITGIFLIDISKDDI